MMKKQTFIDSCSHKKLTNFKVVPYAIVPYATKTPFICFLLIFISNFDFKANVYIIHIYFKLLICICLLNSILNAFLTYNLSFLQWWNKLYKSMKSDTSKSEVFIDNWKKNVIETGKNAVILRKSKNAENFENIAKNKKTEITHVLEKMNSNFVYSRITIYLKR